MRALIPGDISLGAGKDLGRHLRQLRVKIAAKVKQPLGMVVNGEFGSERLRHPPHAAPMAQIELEQPVARHDITLAEERIGLARGADVRHAPAIVDDLDRPRGAAHRLVPRLPGVHLRTAGDRHQRRHRSGSGKEGAAVELHAVLPPQWRLLAGIRAPETDTLSKAMLASYSKR